MPSRCMWSRLRPFDGRVFTLEVRVVTGHAGTDVLDRAVD